MIIGKKIGDIFTTDDKHVIFALNTEGVNDCGFADQVAIRGFEEILSTGGNKLGEVLDKEINGITYHGIVCYSRHNGWEGPPEIILKAINNMKFDGKASILPICCSGFIAIVKKAPVSDIFKAFEDSNKELTIWSMY